MKYFLRLFLAALTVAGCPLIFTPAAQAVKPAAPETGSSTTWSVAPANQDGPDGRAWVNLELEPGQEHTDYLAVKNHGIEAATFSLQRADGYFTENGRFNMLPAIEESTGAGTWLSAASSVTLAPQQTKVLPFTVKVPQNAAPGDHAAGIAAVLSALTHGADGTVGVDSRVGFRVLIQVEGEPEPALAVSELQTSYVPAWNPFMPGSLSATFVVENRGNLILSPQLSLNTWQGTIQDSSELELMPGDRRAYTLRTDTFWPLLLLPTEVSAQASPVYQGQTLTTEAKAQTLTWAWPVSQLVILLAVVLIALGLRSKRRRNKRQLAELIAAARAAGRAEARTTERTVDHEPV